MSSSAKPAEFDATEEHRRIDAAIDVDLPRKAELHAACNTCGATPGSPCLDGVSKVRQPHRSRIADYASSGSARHGPGEALAAVPDTSEIARRGLQQAVKIQILSFCDQEITAKTLGRLQRFCASMGQAMIGLEKPDALVRDRFGGSPSVAFPSLYTDDGAGGVDLALAPSPEIETYGANASRSLIAEAAQIGKDLLESQAKAQAEARKPFPPSMTELVHALVEAKKQKLPKKVLQALEKQIEEAAKSVTPVTMPL